jgi:single-strand DNA-binding protein
MNLNVVNLVGRVGGDPDVKYFESGKVVCKLTLAVNRQTSKDEQPDWFNLEMWDKTAEVAANYVRKGSLIGVQGSLKIETWQDRTTGANRSRPVIRVDRLELLGSKRDNETAADIMGNYSTDDF